MYGQLHFTGSEFAAVIPNSTGALYKAFNTDGYTTRNTNAYNRLKASNWNITESDLTSIDEQNLIFGTTLNIIHNIIALEEEADSAKIIADAGKAKLKAADTKGKEILANMEINKGIRMAEQNQKKKDILNQISDVTKDPVSGTNESIEIKEADVTYIDNNIARTQAQKKKNNEQVQKKNEQLDKKIETLQAAKARANSVSTESTENTMTESMKDVHSKGLDIDNSEEAATTENGKEAVSNKKVIDNLTERDLRLERRVTKDLRKDPGHRVDRDTDSTADNRTAYIEAQNKKAPKEFEDMLFNGESGNALKYFINGEINNGNASDLNIAKLMEKDPDVQLVIKKLKFDLKKVSRNTADDRVYTDMKIMKSQFRSLFNKAKNDYENKKYLGR